ncbi:Beta-galactosidase C-terminal domain [Leifsonia poae]|uniref:Beta-galactosidase C-terminal domain n=1 Tax=Leifsonia poae TaxID=110933 RepID=UPI003D6845AE
MNHGDHDVQLASAGVDLLSGERLESSVVVPAGGVRIIREDAAPVLVPAGDAGISREEAS